MPLTANNKLRKVIFRPFRKGMGPTFTLETWDTGRTGYGGKNLVGYRLRILDKYTGPGCAPSFDTTLFEGEDFGCSPVHCIDSDETIAGIMGFLTLRPGDTDQEYFQDYTQDQLDYCSQWAESLSCEVSNRFGEG